MSNSFRILSLKKVCLCFCFPVCVAMIVERESFFTTAFIEDKAYYVCCKRLNGSLYMTKYGTELMKVEGVHERNVEPLVL